MKAIHWLWLLPFVPIQLTAQTYTEKITREFTFEKKNNKNALIVANINGNISVEGYTGDKILVEVTKSISGKTQARLDKAKSDIKLGVLDLADTIVLYVDGLCGGFGRREEKSGNHFHSGRNWDYQWNANCKGCNEGVDYKMDFVIKVPAILNLDVSTINDGNINVEAVNGIVFASNVNGSIRLQELMSESAASTINGDLDIVYARNPIRDCRFYSLNGDINAWFQKGLAASMSFESFNGAFFTNIDRLEPMPVKVEKTQAREGVKYKVNGNRYQIGSGGAYLEFETFNGNVYLKEKTNQ